MGALLIMKHPLHHPVQNVRTIHTMLDRRTIIMVFIECIDLH